MRRADPGGPSAGEPRSRSAASNESDAGEAGSTRRTDGGDRRPEERLRTELEGLDQDPSAYETRDQSVIDRYERLLDERRQRMTDGEEEDGRRESRRQRLKTRVLSLFGLR